MSRGVTWWRPDGDGYTVDLASAGIYTRADARARTDRDVFVPLAAVHKEAMSVVRIGIAQRLTDDT